MNDWARRMAARSARAAARLATEDDGDDDVPVVDRFASLAHQASIHIPTQRRPVTTTTAPPADDADRPDMNAVLRAAVRRPRPLAGERLLADLNLTPDTEGN